MYENNQHINTSERGRGRGAGVRAGERRRTSTSEQDFISTFLTAAAAAMTEISPGIPSAPMAAPQPSPPPPSRININEILQKYNVIMNNYSTIVERMVPYTNSNLMDGYNNNISLYQKNIESVIRQYEEEFKEHAQRQPNGVEGGIRAPSPQISSNSSAETSRRSRTRPINLLPRRTRRNETEIFSFFIPYNDTSGTTSTARQGLTQSQIDEKTETIPYNSSMNEISCPITYEDFTIGESVCRIKQCGHFFKPSAIQNWLTNNVYCPICRHDLLEDAATASSPVPQGNERDSLIHTSDFLLPSITIEIQGMTDASENQNIISRFFDSMNIQNI